MARGPPFVLLPQAPQMLEAALLLGTTPPLPIPQLPSNLYMLVLKIEYN